MANEQLTFYRISYINKRGEQRYLSGDNRDTDLYRDKRGCKGMISRHIKYLQASFDRARARGGTWDLNHERELDPNHYQIEEWVLTKTS